MGYAKESQEIPEGNLNTHLLLAVIVYKRKHSIASKCEELIRISGKAARAHFLVEECYRSFLYISLN